MTSVIWTVSQFRLLEFNRSITMNRWDWCTASGVIGREGVISHHFKTQATWRP